MKDRITHAVAGRVFISRRNRLTRFKSPGSLMAILLVGLIITTCSDDKNKPFPGVLPRPQIENYLKSSAILAEQGLPITLSLRTEANINKNPVNQGISLLSARVEFLGGKLVVRNTASGEAQLILEQPTSEKMMEILQTNGASEVVSGKRLNQAYILHCRDNSDPKVAITACGEIGLYYGLVSLCQLIHGDQSGTIYAKEAMLADWPEIGIRLAKASATFNSLSRLELFTQWLPIFKMRTVGLQYHGGNSKAPEEPFLTNIKAVCRDNRESGILESVVYFCPFRGGGEKVVGVDHESYKKPGAYDFTQESDREQYAQFLQWIMAQGAHGIEIDYNDWPGLRTPIEDVINLACDALTADFSEAYILYCAPNKGASQYLGEASPEMRRILSQVPSKVWPIWTGLHYLMTHSPVTAVQAEAWTRAAGRRPFLWINRVQIDVEESLSQLLTEGDSTYVFRGETIPKELNRLFEGTHFNSDTHLINNEKELVYFATAADYVWNPQAWNPYASGQRAKHFVAIMLPLLGLHQK
jgi:hypothetical protein